MKQCLGVGNIPWLRNDPLNEPRVRMYVDANGISLPFWGAVSSSIPLHIIKKSDFFEDIVR